MSFTWRHKMLSALKRLQLSECEELLEIDETYFLYSEKGNKNIKGRKPRKRGGSSPYRGISREQVCVVVARDRTKNTLATVACMGPINKLKAGVLLTPYVGKVSMVRSDANGTWRAFADERGIEHKELNLKQKRRVIQKIYHIQNVNSFHRSPEKVDRPLQGRCDKISGQLPDLAPLSGSLLKAEHVRQETGTALYRLPAGFSRAADIRKTTLVLP